MSSDTTTLLTSIIIPLIVAPISWYASKLYERRQQDDYNKRKEIYEKKKKEFEMMLDQFLYPIYFKLLLIYQLDYNIPDEEEEDELSDTVSESSDSEYQKERCIGYYKKSSRDFYMCRNEIPINSKIKVCKKCRWKYAKGKIDLQLHLLNRSSSYVAVNMQEELNEDMSFDALQTRRKLSKMSYLKKEIDNDTIEKLNRTLIEIYKDIKILIENNVHIIKPSFYERNKYVNLLKFIELKLLVSNDLLIKNDFGVKKNYVSVLSLVENKLNTISNSYNLHIENGI